MMWAKVRAYWLTSSPLKKSLTVGLPVAAVVGTAVVVKKLRR